MAEINGGNAWKSGDYSKDGNCLVVTIANVQGNSYIDDSIGNHIDIKGATPFDLAQDDILISLTGNVGRVSRMTSSKAVLNQRVGKVISKELIDDEYLFQIMRTDSFLDAMVSAGQGAAQMNISNSDVLNYQFKMPTLKEQKNISILLRNLDTLITLHQRMCSISCFCVYGSRTNLVSILQGELQVLCYPCPMPRMVASLSAQL